MLPPLLLLACLAQEPADHEGGPERFALENGVRVTVVHLPEGEQQACFTFLPTGLLDEGPGATQASHLLEHMMIRSTDPQELVAGELRLGGETLGRRVRLESVGPPGATEMALERHAAWLRARSWEEGVLDRERRRIGEEIDATLATGATHKWALAAWNQVVRHGADSVSVRGALADWSLDDVRGALEQGVHVGPGIELLVTGPLDAAALRPILERTVGRVPGGEAWPEPAPLPTPKEKALEAHWDLDARHLLVWYPLPLDRPWHRMVGPMFAMRLGARFFQERDGPLASGRALATVEWPAPDQPLLVLSASLADDVRPHDVEKLLEREVADLARAKGFALGDQVRMAVPMLERQRDPAGTLKQMLTFMDREELRERGFVEAQLGLQLVQVERSHGMDIGELIEVARLLDEDEVEQLAKRGFPRKARRTLLLEPAD